MALNYPGPYELRFTYTMSGLNHTMRHSVNLNVVPTAGQSFATINALTPSGATPQLSTWVESFLTEVGKQYNASASTFGVVELWKYVPLSFDSTFVTSFVPIAQPTSTALLQLCQQTTYSFRTVEGGIMKIVLLETVNDTQDIHTYPSVLTNPNSLMALIADPTSSPVVARDTSAPFSPLRMSNGQNEAVFRKRYR